jgi:hypothetical protein
VEGFTLCATDGGSLVLEGPHAVLRGKYHPVQQANPTQWAADQSDTLVEEAGKHSSAVRKAFEDFELVYHAVIQQPCCTGDACAQLLEVIRPRLESTVAEACGHLREAVQHCSSNLQALTASLLEPRGKSYDHLTLAAEEVAFAMSSVNTLSTCLECLGGAPKGMVLTESLLAQAPLPGSESESLASLRRKLDIALESARSNCDQLGNTLADTLRNTLHVLRCARSRRLPSARQ